MPTPPESRIPEWALPALSWIVSLYFLAAFVANVGFPPDRKLFAGDAFYAFLWLLFLFLPFFNKVKIGAILELERDVAKAKEDLQDFKVEVRNSMSVLSTNVNTIGGMNNQVTVNLPGLAELREARKSVDAMSPESTHAAAGRVEERLALQSEDTTMALAKTRIEIERLLRMILDKQLSLSSDTDIPTKFASAPQLFQTFIRQNDHYAYLAKPFKYVTQVCSAAIHAQRVSDEQAQEALALGAQIIAILKSASDGIE
jgi:hypothetical protein